MEAAAQRTSGLLLLIFLIQFFAFGLWAGGPRTDLSRDCVFNIELTSHIGHSVNCDSSEFVMAAAEPAYVLEPESKRQSRPGTVIFSYLLTKPFVWATGLPGGGEKRTISFYDADKDYSLAFEVGRAAFLANYVGYLVMHVLILVATYILYLRLAGLGRDRPDRLRTAAALAGIVIFVNNVTKQFLWSPHTQLFNLMAPLLAIYLFVSMLKSDRPERLFILSALGCGVGMLFYGIFVLPITVMGLAYLWRRRAALRDLAQAGRTLCAGFCAIAAFFLPYGLWVGFIVWRNGEFYNYDVEYYGGFVWLANVVEARGLGKGLSLLGGNFVSMFAGAFMQGWGFILLLGGLIAATARLPEKPAGAAALWWGAGLYMLLAAMFFAFYGLTVARLSYTLTAALFPLIGFYLYHLERHSARPARLKALTLAAVCLYVFFMLAKYGPYS